VVPATGKHRRPDVRPLLAGASELYADHPSAPQPRILDSGWAPWIPPYGDYPSWPQSGGTIAGRPPRPGCGGADSRDMLPAPPLESGWYPALAPPGQAAPGTGTPARSAPGPGTYDRAPEVYRDASGGQIRMQGLPAAPPGNRDAVPGYPGAPVRDARPARARPSGLASVEDSIRLANGILADADTEAAGIMAEAAAQAAAARATAEQEAARIRQEASDHAAELRASAAQAVADLRQLAASVLDNLTAGVAPLADPVAATTTGPAFAPATRPQSRPPARLRPQPAGRPAARPKAKPAGSTRQTVAMRKVTACVAALCLLGAASGAGELAEHGWKFFVFRGGGVGQTSGNQTDQQFLARQAAQAHHAAQPGGRHAKPPAIAVPGNH
jgi:hypothetical protein